MAEPNVEKPEEGAEIASSEPGKSVADNAELLKQLEAVVSKAVDERVPKIVDEKLKPIRGDIGGLYSRSDKDRNSLNRLLDEYENQKAKGLDKESAGVAAQNALKEQDRGALKDQLIETLAEKLGLSASNTNTGAFDVGKAIVDAGLDANDPDTIAFMARKDFRNEDHAMAEALKLKVRKASAPQPTDAEKLAATGKSGKTDVQALVDEMNNPLTTFPRMQEIQQELAKQGQW